MCGIYRTCNGCAYEYGLPTANMVGGFTIEGKDVFGFDFNGEWDRNLRFFQYPNPAIFSASGNHEISSLHADAYFFSLSRQQYPWFGFFEGYSIAQDYSTTAAFVVDHSGDILYDSPHDRLLRIRRRPTTIKTAYPIGCAGGNQSAIILSFPAGMKTTTSSPISIRTTTPPYPIACPITKNLF